MCLRSRLVVWWCGGVVVWSLSICCSVLFASLAASLFCAHCFSLSFLFCILRLAHGFLFYALRFSPHFLFCVVCFSLGFLFRLLRFLPSYLFRALFFSLGFLFFALASLSWFPFLLVSCSAPSSLFPPPSALLPPSSLLSPPSSKRFLSYRSER